jgi:hypothetical protein
MRVCWVGESSHLGWVDLNEDNMLLNLGRVDLNEDNMLVNLGWVDPNIENIIFAATMYMPIQVESTSTVILNGQF